MELIEENEDKINWNYLSKNPNAIELLKKNKDKINWVELSTNPNAMSLLKANKDKINWYYISRNPSIFKQKSVISNIMTNLNVFIKHYLIKWLIHIIRY
jgi:hypothetical protein